MYSILWLQLKNQACGIIIELVYFPPPVTYIEPFAKTDAQLCETSLMKANTFDRMPRQKVSDSL